MRDGVLSRSGVQDFTRRRGTTVGQTSGFYKERRPDGAGVLFIFFAIAGKINFPTFFFLRDYLWYGTYWEYVGVY